VELLITNSVFQYLKSEIDSTLLIETFHSVDEFLDIRRSTYSLSLIQKQEHEKLILSTKKECENYPTISLKESPFYKSLKNVF